MLDVSKIFLPVDGSRGSRAALNQAQQLAKATQAQIQCVHAVPSMLHYMQATLFPFAALGNEELVIQTELRNNALKSLRRYLLEKEHEGVELEVQMATEATSVSDVLLGRLGEVEAELVFMGSSGESGDAPGRLGSVLERVVTQCPRPTFIARTSEQRRTIKRIAVALDLSSISQEAYTQALEAALLYEASLQVVVVIPDPRTQDIGGVVSAAIKMDPNAIRKKAERDVRKKLARIRDEVKVPFPWREKRQRLRKDEKDLMLFGDPAEQIIQTVNKNNIDLLVIGRVGYQRTNLMLRAGRTARALMGHAPCHLLVVPSSPKSTEGV